MQSTALEPGKVARHVDDMAARHLADLIDAIGELVAPVLDMDAGLRMDDVAPVDIGNARHGHPQGNIRLS